MNEKMTQNAFSEPFIVPIELFDIIAGMDSAVEKKDQPKLDDN